MRIHIMWVCVLTTVAVAVGQQTAPTDAEQAEGPAAEGLVHSAVGLIHAPADTPARAGRLVVLLLYAQRLDPRDAETCRLLAGVYESRNQPALAAKNLENCREALKHPCYEVDCRRLVLLLDQRERTEDRMALLEDMLADDNLPPSVRAVAAVKMARLHRGRGELRDARDAYERALALDPTNPDAAEGLLRVTENPTAADEVEALLRLLSGNPKAVAVAWDVASLLDSLGLHERALTFFEHAHRTAVAAGDEQALSAEFVTEYCNAMLNAGEHERAADLFGPVLQQFEDHADLHALLVEAYREAGQTDRADEIVASLRGLYAGQASDEEASPRQTAERAWFLLITADEPQAAAEYAAKAVAEEPEDGFIRRVNAACLVRTDEPDQARDTLEDLQNRDVYAAVFLAEALFDLGEPDAAAEALRSVVSRSRSGPAYRQAREVALRHEVSLPSADEADATAELADGFDTSVLEMGYSPEDFISVELRPTNNRVAPGEPIVLEATLSNVGHRDVTIGDWGLLTPSISFKAESDPDTEPFTRLPLLTWPAPRHLKSGESITTSLRLDVANLGRELFRRPLRELTVTFHPTLDPIETSEESIVSALPQVQVEPVTIVRTSLSDADEQPDSQNVLTGVEDPLDEGDVRQRMLAARRIGMLLASARLSQAEGSAPSEAETQPTDERLNALLERALADESPAVRAEMVASLQPGSLDEAVLRRLGRTINDRSPLVRMRIAELLGTADPREHQPVLRHLSRDDDELVREMAGLFVSQRD